MEKFNSENTTIIESYFERSQRLENEKREKMRGEIKSDLGGELVKFIVKKYSPKEGKSEMPQLKELREKYLAITERIKSDNLEVDDLEEIEELVKSIGQYINYWQEKSRGNQEAEDEIIKFRVLAEELDTYSKKV
jgi:MoaA/NifB/PqqE/SkfB family radical SAM enzyme